MQRMLPLFARSLSRRALTGVLALWLCVVAAGVWAPMARAQLALQGVERLCSGEVVPQWALHPAAHTPDGEGAAPHHLIDCPLCLPALAPPPRWHSSALHSAPQWLCLAPVAAWRPQAALPWPPARGPPSLTPTLG